MAQQVAVAQALLVAAQKRDEEGACCTGVRARVSDHCDRGEATRSSSSQEASR
jgi:hypothetical protein